jgi:hypothetical protein
LPRFGDKLGRHGVRIGRRRAEDIAGAVGYLVRRGQQFRQLVAILVVAAKKHDSDDGDEQNAQYKSNFNIALHRLVLRGGTGMSAVGSVSSSDLGGILNSWYRHLRRAR